MIEELIARTFNARNTVHLEHWTTKSYATHVALGALYDGLIDSIDAIIENYQGQLGPIGQVKLTCDGMAGDVVTFLLDEADWIEANREELSGGSSSVGNLLDTLTAQYTKTVFLLGLK